MVQGLTLKSIVESEEIGKVSSQNSSKNAAILVNQDQFSQSNFSGSFSGSYSDWKVKTELEIVQNQRESEKLTKIENKQKLIQNLSQINFEKYPKPWIWLGGNFFDQKGQNVMQKILEENNISENGYAPRLFEPIISGNKIYQPIGIDLIMILDLNLGIVDYVNSGFSFDDVSISSNRIYINPKSETNQNNCNYYDTEKCVIFEFDPTSKRFQEVYNTEKLQQMGAGPCGNAKIKVEFVDEKNIYFSYDCGENYVAKYDKNGQFVEAFSFENFDEYGCYEICNTYGYGWVIKKWSKDPKLVSLELAKIRRKNYENYENDYKNLKEKSESSENLENKLAEIENQYSQVFLESKEKLDCSLEENKYQCQDCRIAEEYQKLEIEKTKQKAKLENKKFACYDYDLKEKLKIELSSESQKLFPFELNYLRIRNFNLSKKLENGELKAGKCGNFIWEWKNLEGYNSLQLQISNLKITKDKYKYPKEVGIWLSFGQKISCIQ